MLSYATHSTSQRTAKPSCRLSPPWNNHPGSSRHQRPRKHAANEGPACPRAKDLNVRMQADGPMLQEASFTIPAKLLCPSKARRIMYILRPCAATQRKEAGHKPARGQSSSLCSGCADRFCAAASSCADRFCTAPDTSEYFACLVSRPYE